MRCWNCETVAPGHVISVEDDLVRGGQFCAVCYKPWAPDRRDRLFDAVSSAMEQQAERFADEVRDKMTTMMIEVFHLHALDDDRLRARHREELGNCRADHLTERERKVDAQEAIHKAYVELQAWEGQMNGPGRAAAILKREMQRMTWPPR